MFLMKVFTPFARLLYNFIRPREKITTSIQMNEKNVQSVISYILERARDLEFSIGKTRLTKFLYLLDIEYYRLYQRTFTDLVWIFYKYGPYSFEIEPALIKLDIIEDDIPIGGTKLFKKMKMDFDEREADLGIETKAIIGKLIDEWGTADLNELLDFVYFETEPMRKVEFKQRLDFSQVEPRKAREEKIVLSAETKSKLRDLGKDLCKKLERIEVPDNPLIGYPSELSGKLSFLTDELTDLSPLIGKVRAKSA
jgi:hypothetical protein